MSAASVPQRLWAPLAWIKDDWSADVLLTIGADGCWQSVDSGVPRPADAQHLDAPLLPGLVNAHGHAFQRAFAGLAEQRHAGQDDFWGWRERMYAVAGRITPDQLRAVATQLYTELLAGGYTEICEFHYLRETPDGSGDETLALTQPLIDAAAQVGIGLTLLPVLYERAGFAQDQPNAAQQRFRRHADDVLALAERVNGAARARAQGASPLQAGLAIHSLRAAAPASIHALIARAGDASGPIHIHVSEQYAEVADCLAHTGKRPIEWLAAEGLLDARWNLVHATHASAAEIAAVAHAGAAVVLCPSTEGNLGDGFTDVPRWLASGVPLAMGSDSHVTRAWPEELRWIEYGQRLLLRQRNVAADPDHGQPSTAARLWQSALDASAQAMRVAAWGLQAGARADALVVNMAEPALLGVPPARTLDALVFSSPLVRPFKQVMVAGRWVTPDGAAVAAGASEFAAALQALHG